MNTDGRKRAIIENVEPEINGGRFPIKRIIGEKVAERKKALFSAWYEFFPRSASGSGRHGTFKDCVRLLPELAEMGFDVLYLPPIHPIGETHRKGKNNSPKAQADDVGCPWAIGGKDGGHKAIHPQLGTIQDFKNFLKKAGDLNMEVAMDLALQCSPDHPYVKDHPDWFRWRPDGSVQFAENPPKKYEDILPIHFETPNWKELWEELKGVVLFWHDLLSDDKYIWQGERNYVELDPKILPAHVFEVRKRLKREYDFDYFL